jgi:phosphate transport system protein
MAPMWREHSCAAICDRCRAIYWRGAAVSARLRSEMFDAAMSAYADGADEATARAVAARDDAVDSAERLLIEEIMDWIRSRPQDVQAGVSLLSIAHNYERVADRATNIAERVIYVATGVTPDLD